MAAALDGERLAPFADGGARQKGILKMTNGWNGSGGGSTPQKPKETAKKSLPIRLFVVCVLLCMSVGGLCLYFFAGEKTEVIKEPVRTKKSQIKETLPAVLVTNEIVAVEAKKKEHHVGEIWYDENGKKMITLEKNGIIKDVEVFIPKNKKVPKYRIFDFKSENAIANLICVPPGTPTFGRRSYAGMTEDFLKSCQVPIIVKETDDEYTKQLKRAVNQTKIDLKAQVDAGAKVEDIFSEAREDMKRMAQVKRDIEKMVRESAKNPELSEQDLTDLRDAANKMLAEKGIAPLRNNSLVNAKLRHFKELNGEGSK